MQINDVSNLEMFENFGTPEVRTGMGIIIEWEAVGYPHDVGGFLLVSVDDFGKVSISGEDEQMMDKKIPKSRFLDIMSQLYDMAEVK